MKNPLGTFFSIAALLSALALPAAHAAVSTSGCVLSTSCTMSELFAGGAITSDDKLFNGFALNFDVSSVVIDYSKIIASGISSAGDLDPLDPGPGLTFSDGGELSVSGNDKIDFEFSYAATVTDSLHLIKDSALTLNTYDAGTQGTIWLTQDMHLLDQDPMVAIVDPFLGLDKSSASLIFEDKNISPSLFIDTSLFLTGNGGSASLSEFEERYSQTVVPLPAAAWFFVSGAGLIGAFMRRQRN